MRIGKTKAQRKAESTEIGKRLREIREHENVSQTDFARLIGINSLKALAIYEKEGEISDQIFDKLTKVFRVNIAWLLTGTGEMFLSEEEEEKLENRVRKRKLLQEFEAHLDQNTKLLEEKDKRIEELLTQITELREEKQELKEEKRELKEKLQSTETELAQMKMGNK